jgi:hypothetical protein
MRLRPAFTLLARSFADLEMRVLFSRWGGRVMNDNMPHCELPERLTMSDRLASSIDFVREAMTLRLGYEVEVAALEPIDRDGKQNLLVFWRRKAVELRVVA